MKYAIEIEGLTRVYRRRAGWRGPVTEKVALTGIDLDVPAGRIYGILGRNGAGKTTTVKILSTLLLPTAGAARVAGYDVVRSPRAVRARLGVVLGGDRGFYNRLSGRENLAYFGRLYGMAVTDIGRRIAELSVSLRLSFLEERVEGYSRGMKQRLHLARALLHEPPVIVLDEPSLGLDPVAATDMRALVAGLVPRHTVVLTTHDMFEAQELCESVAIMQDGAIIASGTVDRLLSEVTAAAQVRVTASMPAGSGDDLVTRVRNRMPSVSVLDVCILPDHLVRLTARCADTNITTAELLRELPALGLEVREIQVLRPSLRDLFLAKVGADR